MRNKVIAALLSAAVILPGMASAQNGDRRAERRAERQAERADRSDRGQANDRQREGRAERRGERRDDGPREQRVERRDGAPRERIERRAERRDVAPRDQRQLRRTVDGDRLGIDRRDDRRQGFDGRGAYRDRGDYRGNDRRYNQAYNGSRNWNRGWRQDRRYDWNRYRTYNRSAYRLPRYYSPYGWNGGYRRFSVGIRLAAPLWGQNYWINDPYSYRLPPAYGGYRWVRYYNDAILVDVRSGNVVDVIHDIFY